MSIEEFIKCADRLDREIITEVSMEDVAMMKSIMKDYTRLEVTQGTILSRNASELDMVLRWKRNPGEKMEHNLYLNGLIYLLFVADSGKVKKEMLEYLRSHENPSVNMVLNKYFPTTPHDTMSI
jgi:hypothetical protein